MQSQICKQRQNTKRKFIAQYYRLGILEYIEEQCSIGKRLRLYMQYREVMVLNAEFIRAASSSFTDFKKSR